MKAILPDVLMILGGASTSYGAWLAYQPAGFLLAGVLTIYAGIMLAKGQ